MNTTENKDYFKYQFPLKLTKLDTLSLFESFWEEETKYEFPDGAEVIVDDFAEDDIPVGFFTDCVTIYNMPGTIFAMSLHDQNDMNNIMVAEKKNKAKLLKSFQNVKDNTIRMQSKYMYTVADPLVELLVKNVGGYLLTEYRKTIELFDKYMNGKKVPFTREDLLNTIDKECSGLPIAPLWKDESNTESCYLQSSVDHIYALVKKVGANVEVRFLTEDDKDQFFKLSGPSKEKFELYWKMAGLSGYKEYATDLAFARALLNREISIRYMLAEIDLDVFGNKIKRSEKRQILSSYHKK